MKKLVTILLNINALPTEYKNGNLLEDIKKYEKDFNVRVIPYDDSKSNIAGSCTSDFIKVIEIS